MFAGLFPLLLLIVVLYIILIWYTVYICKIMSCYVNWELGNNMAKQRKRSLISSLTLIKKHFEPIVELKSALY
jgi:hypothetical protein